MSVKLKPLLSVKIRTGDIPSSFELEEKWRKANGLEIKKARTCLPPMPQETPPLLPTTQQHLWKPVQDPVKKAVDVTVGGVIPFKKM